MTVQRKSQNVNDKNYRLSVSTITRIAKQTFHGRKENFLLRENKIIWLLYCCLSFLFGNAACRVTGIHVTHSLCIIDVSFRAIFRGCVSFWIFVFTVARELRLVVSRNSIAQHRKQWLWINVKNNIVTTTTAVESPRSFGCGTSVRQR